MKGGGTAWGDEQVPGVNNAWKTRVSGGRQQKEKKNYSLIMKTYNIAVADAKGVDTAQRHSVDGARKGWGSRVDVACGR